MVRKRSLGPAEVGDGSTLLKSKLMPNNTSGKSYIVYEAHTVSLHAGASRILLTTPDKHEALRYASAHGATVYAYDRGDDGALSNATFVYHLATFGAQAVERARGFDPAV